MHNSHLLPTTCVHVISIYMYNYNIYNRIRSRLSIEHYKCRRCVPYKFNVCVHAAE